MKPRTTTENYLRDNMKTASDVINEAVQKCQNLKQDQCIIIANRFILADIQHYLRDYIVNTSEIIAMHSVLYKEIQFHFALSFEADFTYSIFIKA